MTATSTDPKHWNVGLVGYGEVGRILAEDLRKQDVKVTAYDIKLRSDQAGGAFLMIRNKPGRTHRRRYLGRDHLPRLTSSGGALKATFTSVSTALK